MPQLIKRELECPNYVVIWIFQSSLFFYVVRNIFSNTSKIVFNIKKKIWDIVVVTILAVLADCNEWQEIVDYAEEEKTF